MSKLLLLYLTFVVTLLFLLVPENDVAVGFPLSSMKVSLEYYIYAIFERSVLIILTYIIANESTEYRGAIWVFFWLCVADFLEYLLTYSSVWFYIDGFPVSMNVLKCVIFGGTILYVWSRALFK